MDVLAECSVEEQIEILSLIEQQLTIRIKLRSRLAPIKSHDVLFAPTPLRKAIKESAPLTMFQLPDGLEQQVAAVRPKLDELRIKQNDVSEINQRCKKLIEAVERARECVNQGPRRDWEGEHNSTSGDLDVLINEASAIVELCTRFKALYGIPAPLRTEPHREWAASNVHHGTELSRPATPVAARWGGIWSDHIEDEVVFAEDAVGCAENGSVYSETEGPNTGINNNTWGPGPTCSW